jgi:uncharacterized protein
MARYLITGGTGFIGKVLLGQLVAADHELVVITRNPQKYIGSVAESVRFTGKFSDIDNNSIFDAVINLGGEGIGDKRWSDKRKQVLRQSRIGLTEHLVDLLERLETRPKVMISGSAIGWYGAHDTSPLTEDSPYKPEFTHDICEEWEQAASAVTNLGIRLCVIRLGIVLGKNGGALKKMLPPFYFGLGGRIGSGKQSMSWVHINDVIKAINFLVNDASQKGVFNLTAPGAVTNTQFAQAIGKTISRPSIFPLPGFVVKALFGEMGDSLLLKGQNVVPQRLLDKGFTFDFPGLDAALEEILSS